MSNQAVWLKAVDTLELGDFPLPELGSLDVQIKVANVGICGSDVHYWKHGRCGDFILKDPMVIGHESSGVISAVGSGVTHLRVGDRVAIEPGVPCDACEYCTGGRYNLCPDMKFFATPPVHGSLSNFVVHPAKWCFPLPEQVSLEEGALCEPLSVGVHCLRRLGAQSGNSLLILGAGPIGLVTLMVAKAQGVGTICITDICPKRLAFAKECGADITLNVTGKSAEEVAEELKGFTWGGTGSTPGPHGAVDCAGAETTIRTAVLAVRPGATVVLVGMASVTASVGLCAASAREVNLVGSFRYCNTYPTCIELLASGKVPAKKLITHRFGPLSMRAVEQGFQAAHEGTGIKVMFCLDQEPSS